jgi:hypothetical protein
MVKHFNKKGNEWFIILGALIAIAFAILLLTKAVNWSSLFGKGAEGSIACEKKDSAGVSQGVCISEDAACPTEFPQRTASHPGCAKLNNKQTPDCCSVGIV